MKISTQWLKDFVDITPPWPRIADRLTMAGLEVKKFETIQKPTDCLFDIEVTTNRADWLSHWGVAREVAAVENLSLKNPKPDDGLSRTPPSGWKIKLKDADGCPYYTGVLIEGITETRTPDFIIERLTVCGVRSVNLLVDITNYVMLAIGQPLHVFDADLLQGKEIQLRRAKQGEKFRAIDGALLELSQDDLIVADNQNPIALAGVMGGRDTEITERTRNVFIESAFFHPARVRKTTLKHHLFSESSYRFERRVDPEVVDLASALAVSLIRKYAKPRYISGMMRSGEKPQLAVKMIHLRGQEVQDTLGLEIKPREIVSILTRLGLEVTQLAGGSWRIKIPSFRPDLTRSIDLIEEIARIYGYDRIPETLPQREPLVIGEHPRLQLEAKTRRFLSAAGLYETVTFSLLPDTGLDPKSDLPSAVQIINPQHKGLHWMRPTLMPSLLSVVQKNVSAAMVEKLAIFEIANIYYYNLELQKHPVEERVCGLALYGKKEEKSWLDPERNVAFYDLKGILEKHFTDLGCETIRFRPAKKSYLKPGVSEEIILGEQNVGFLGEVKPQTARQWDLKEPVFYGEFSLEKVLPWVHWVRPFCEWPRYPAIKRDVALVVKDSVKGGEIVEDIECLGKGLIRKIELFDFFRGKRVPKGHKNLAYRLTYQSLDQTLVSNEIHELHEKIADTLAKKYEASFQVK